MGGVKKLTFVIYKITKNLGLACLGGDAFVCYQIAINRNFSLKYRNGDNSLCKHESSGRDVTLISQNHAHAYTLVKFSLRFTNCFQFIFVKNVTPRGIPDFIPIVIRFVMK